MRFISFFEHFNLVVFYAFSIFGYSISVFLVAFHVPVVITIKIERRDAELSTETLLKVLNVLTSILLFTYFLYPLKRITVSYWT